MNKHIEILAHRGTVSALAITMDSRFLISGGFDGAIQVWALPDMAIQFSFSQPYKGDTLWDGDNPEQGGPQANAVNCIGVSPDSCSIATGDNHGTIYLWSLTRGQQLESLSAGNSA